jgi:Alginate export
LEEVSMTRKLLSAMAVMASVLLTGAIAAQAAPDVTFGGEHLTRYELRQQSDTAGVNNGFFQMRNRLNANVKVDDNISAFTQLQMVSVFGGGGVGSFVPSSPNDSNTDVGLHQAYIKLNNLFDVPVAAQIGRQEIVLDGHRLFGNTLWTMGAQSHDAIRLTHSHDNMTLLYAYSQVTEVTNALDANDEFDNEAHIFWGNFKGLVGENSSTSAYLVYTDLDSGKVVPGVGSNDMWTIGVRQAGGMGDISYRGEFYYQTGQSSDLDINALMVGARLGYTASQVAMKPKATLWVDYLSGNDLSDPTELGGFNTLFDTGHKFYGLQDILLAQTGPSNAQTGLIDLAIKLQAQPMANLTVKVDLHSFTAAEDNAVGSDDIGEEIDITVVHKYSPNVKMLLGFSYFMGDSSFTNGSNYSNAAGRDDDQSWVYAMLHLKF